VPALRAGQWVISDRYVLSSLAYQSLDLPQSYIASINSRAPRPDLTLFLDVPPEVSLRRRRAQTAHRDLFEDLATQRRVAGHYQAALAGLPGVDLGPTEVIDGTASIADVGDAIEARVGRRFKLRRAGASPPGRAARRNPPARRSR
jgi:dTMP kinase